MRLAADGGVHAELPDAGACRCLYEASHTISSEPAPRRRPSRIWTLSFRSETC